MKEFNKDFERVFSIYAKMNYEDGCVFAKRTELHSCDDIMLSHTKFTGIEDILIDSLHQIVESLNQNQNLQELKDFFYQKCKKMFIYRFGVFLCDLSFFDAFKKNFFG